jgi:uncharacterized membrane protein
MDRTASTRSHPKAAPSNASRWEPDRLEAFSSAVMAVLITIMAFNIHAPAGGSVHALGQRLPALLIYALSFIAIGMAWNHHHQLFRATDRISPGVMWANLHSLFWLSLVPVVTQWVGSDYREKLPASAYGVIALGSAAAYVLLVRAVIAANGEDSVVGLAVGSDIKGYVTMGLYAIAVGLAWLSPWIAYALYVAVALVWFVPDRRFAASNSDRSGPTTSRAGHFRIK